jgi:hypothetical protein
VASTLYKLGNMAKKTDDILKWTGILAVAYLILTQAGNAIYNRITFGRPTLRVNRLTATGIQISFSIPITNETPVGFPLDSLTGEVLYGTNSLSSFFLNRQVIIAANDTTALDFNATIEYSQLSNSVANIIDSQVWLQALKFKGFATSSGVVFPFENTFQVGV